MGDKNSKKDNKKILYVDLNLKSSGNERKKNHFKKIQDALDKAKVENTIFVKKGSYKENIVINKKIVLIGEGKNETILIGEKFEDVIKITNDQVEIKEFTIKGGNCGINVKSNNNVIKENIIIDNNIGIKIREKKFNIISRNKISHNTDGLILEYCGFNKIFENKIFENDVTILIQNSHYNSLIGNEIYKSLLGIGLVFSSNNLIENNIIRDNGWKIKNAETMSIGGSGGNIVINNIFRNNRYKKIEVARDKEINYIYNNEFEGKIEKKYLGNIDKFGSFVTWFPTGLFPLLLLLSFPFNSLNEYKRYFRRISFYLNNWNKKNSNYYDLSEIEHINKKNNTHKKVIIKKQSLADGSNKEDLVIITIKEFSNKLKALSEHKNRREIKTKIVTLDEIYLSKYFKNEGRDEAEQIKYFIKNCLEKWSTRFILLVGNINKIPMRETWSAGNDIFSTDLYYANIYDKNKNFSSWDSNNNNYFGEFYHNGKNDEICLTPDIGIGRLPCKNKKEVEIVVNKIINYENTSFKNDWANRAILCGGDDFPNYRTPAGEYLCDFIGDKIGNEYKLIKLYSSNKKLNIKNIIKEINKGAGILFLTGHGNEGLWYTFSSDTKRIGVITTLHNILSLHNKKGPPITFIAACATGNLNYNNKLFPCFAWSLVKNKNGGATATVASTQMEIMRVEKNNFAGSAGLSKEFFNEFKNGRYLSHVLMSAQKNYAKNIGRDYETLLSYNLFGDPSLKIGGYPQ